MKEKTIESDITILKHLSKDSGIDHLQHLIWKETDITCLLLEDYPPLKPNLKSIKL